MIEHKGCLLEFLPPYSPDYNPIEESFSIIKHYCQKHSTPRKTRNEEAYAEFILDAASISVTPEIAVNLFRSARVT